LSQGDSLVIEYLGKEIPKKSALNIPEKYTEIWDYNDSTVAYQSPGLTPDGKLTDKRTIIYNNKQFDVETFGGTAIAPMAGILVKYGNGDLLNSRERHEFKVIYYDLNKGSKLFELPKKYEGAYCYLSENGYMVMSGRLLGYKDIEGSAVSLYNRKGEEIFIRKMGYDNVIRDIQISPNGNYIALVYTTLMAQPPNDRYNLMIMDAKGVVLFDKRYSIPFHHLIFSPDEKYLLGITNNYTCLLDIKDQKLIWENNNYYKTGNNPALFFKELNCILIPTRFKGLWSCYLLDINTGEEIYKTELQEKQPSTYNKSLYQKSKDEFIIKSPTSIYNYKIKHKN
jgi:hypothetical protein